MNNFADKALQHLTGKANINDASVEELQALADKHPYFSVVHFLLAKKLKTIGDERYLSQIQKTALHFTNPHWLHYQLLEDVPHIKISGEENGVIKNDSNYISPETQNNVLDLHTHELSAARDLARHTLAINETQIVAENIEEKESIQHIDEAEEEVVPDEMHPEPEEILEDILEDIELENTVANNSTEQKISVSETNVTNEPLIVFEPYHTVDYFASQGIKFISEKNPQDKLGKQLRSFTDWLKHMKKVGPHETLQALDSKTETNIQHIAGNSNTPEDVITEAMGEVLEKQGKTAQAINIYEKLSFQNPAKSPYFAHKIQHLKGN